MGEIERLQAQLAASRRDLLAAVAGASDETLNRPGPSPARPRPVGDVLWHVGLYEDWARRTVDQGLHGREPGPYVPRERPAIARSAGYLAEWLEQCRRPLLALLRRLPDDAVDRTFTAADGELTTARRMLEQLVDHERGHTDQVQALLRQRRE